MHTTIQTRLQMRQAIDEDIARRQRDHQRALTMLRTAQTTRTAARMANAAVPQAPQPLVLLANGDSWFDYPLSGNDPTLRSTDVIRHLQTMPPLPPQILNLAHHGDATTNAMGLPRQQRMIEALSDPDNWLASGKPDAILFSGGGDDIAGDQFIIFLDYAGGSSGLDPVRFAGVLELVRASYLDLFAFRDRYAAGVPVFAHNYDFPIPNGVHPACAGPWLKPSLDLAGISVADGTTIVRNALTAFAAMLDGLAADPANNFHVVRTQGTLTPADWANELHPYPRGFNEIAIKFRAALAAAFPGRI